MQHLNQTAHHSSNQGLSAASTHHQSQGSIYAPAAQLTTPISNIQLLQQNYSMKKYDSVKKYLDLAKINRRVTANDIKKLGSLPLKGFHPLTESKQAMTMEGIHRRMSGICEKRRESELSQVNLPFPLQREDLAKENMRILIPQTRAIHKGDEASQRKAFFDDTTSIVNLPGGVKRFCQDTIDTPLKDKQVQRFILPSAEADKIASQCPSVRYQYEDRGKRTFGGARIYEGEFNISHQMITSPPQQMQAQSRITRSATNLNKRNTSTFQIG